MGWGLPQRLAALLVVGIAVGGATVFGLQKYQEHERGDTRNFRIEYPVLTGWKVLEPGPQTLFLYQHPESKVLLRGAQNQVIADVNPMPGQGSKQLAQHYIETTLQNQEGWSAEHFKEVKGNGVTYSLIRREAPYKSVITAFGARGNTVLIVSLSANEAEKGDFDAHVADLERMLRTIRFVESTESHLRAVSFKEAAVTP